MYEIKAVLKSPLMIGGKTKNSNYRESRDYIPGSVLRAAYAKALIERCACGQEKNWLEYKGESQCEECEFRAVCKNFAGISFPFLYPEGSRPYPVTARTKKYKLKEEESVLDILKSRLTADGKAPEEDTWERLEGFHREGKKVELFHSVITRTAIDYRRNAARIGYLYTENVISDKCKDKDKNSKFTEVVFSGEISLSPEEEEALGKLRILHIGAGITKGFGICHMSLEEGREEDTADKIEKRIQEFHEGIEGGKRFVVLDFLTDAYLGLEKIREDSLSQTQVTDEEMLIFLEKAAGLPTERYRLRKVFKSQEILRGFDTSKETEKEMRRKSYLVVKAGAVLVYEDLTGKIDKEKLFELEKKGIGKHTNHGFGKIRICDCFHVRYDVQEGGNGNGNGTEKKGICWEGIEKRDR